ncbi:hypothetical protein K438DRAFT_1830594 [Mycena galopus ATCC 62051]|nr:hypothetical protein K438DRAFT_1830594 [Mycena galopus ATCC 62051]
MRFRIGAIGFGLVMRALSDRCYSVWGSDQVQATRCGLRISLASSAIRNSLMSAFGSAATCFGSYGGNRKMTCWDSAPKKATNESEVTR